MPIVGRQSLPLITFVAEFWHGQRIGSHDSRSPITPLQAQCLISHITQLAAIVPPTNKTKQNAPNRIIIRGSLRCVIPNTTEVNNENSRTALK